MLGLCACLVEDIAFDLRFFASNLLLSLAPGCFFFSSTGFGALFARAPFGCLGRAFSINHFLRAGARTHTGGVDFFGYFGHALFGGRLKARFLFGLMVAACRDRR